MLTSWQLSVSGACHQQYPCASISCGTRCYVFALLAGCLLTVINDKRNETMCKMSVNGNAGMICIPMLSHCLHLYHRCHRCMVYSECTLLVCVYPLYVPWGLLHVQHYTWRSWYADLPTLSWWLLMAWRLIGTRPSATTIIWLWLHPMSHNHSINYICNISY